MTIPMRIKVPALNSVPRSTGETPARISGVKSMEVIPTIRRTVATMVRTGKSGEEGGRGEKSVTAWRLWM